MELKGIIMLLGTVSCTAAGQVLIKKGVNMAGELTILGAITTPLIIIGCICYFFSFAIWLNVLQILDLSIAYPASSFVYVLVIILSALILAEPITVMKVVGMACICVGVVFIGMA